MRVFIVVENYRPDPYTYTYESIVRQVFSSKNDSEFVAENSPQKSGVWYDVIEREVM